MKKLEKLFCLSLILLCTTFMGCPQNLDIDTYTVWTDTGTYTEFTTAFGSTLDDGMYIRLEFTNEMWNQIKTTLTNDGKHQWSKDKIKDWLLGRGFGEYEATKESSWLTTTDHGFIATRTGNTVYYILK